MRGAAEINWVVVVAVMAIIVMIVLLFGFGKGNKAFNENIQSATDSFKQATTLCKLQSILGQGDLDNDGYANKCDICLGGDDSKDIDNDGIPDECDVNKDSKLSMKEDVKKKYDELKKAEVSDADAARKSLLLECRNADVGKEFCCTDKFWNPKTKTCGIST